MFFILAMFFIFGELSVRHFSLPLGNILILRLEHFWGNTITIQGTYHHLTLQLTGIVVSMVMATAATLHCLLQYVICIMCNAV